MGFVNGRDVFLADARCTDFRDEQFDIVFSEGLWEHFTDPRPHMAEAARLAKKYIIVIQPNHFSFFGQLMHIGWRLFSRAKGGVQEYSFPLFYFTDFLRLYGFKLIATKSTILHEQTVMVFKKCVHYYDINSVKVRMLTDKPYKQLELYRIAHASCCDMIFHMGCDMMGHMQCASTANSICVQYKHKLSHWNVRLQDFDKDQTIVHFHGDMLFSRHLFFTMVFEPLLQYKQSKKNKCTLHASAISNSTGAYAFSGDAHVGKTAVLIHFLSTGFKYLADDQAVIDAASFCVLPYVLPLGVHLTLALRTHLSLSIRSKLLLCYQAFVNTLFFHYSNLTTNIPFNRLIFSGVRAVCSEPAKLRKVFVLIHSNVVSMTKLSSQQAFDALWKCKFGSRSKLPALIYYSEEFKKRNMTFSLWRSYHSLLLRLVREVPVYQISFDKKHFLEAFKLIENEIMET